jgi:molybdate-binding protein
LLFFVIRPAAKKRIFAYKKNLENNKKQSRVKIASEIASSNADASVGVSAAVSEASVAISNSTFQG